MKFKLFFTFVSVVIAFSGWGQALTSAVKIGSTTLDQPFAITTDFKNNVYSTGTFSGTVDFIPGAGSFNMTSLVGGDDIYILKQNNNGVFKWAKRIGNNAGDGVQAIETDINGNVYVGGFFTGSVDFNPNAGSNTLNALTNYAGYILKLDSLGNYVWAKMLGNSLLAEVNDMVIDHSGNVVSTGRFDSNIDIDPGAATNNIASIGGDDIFISKLNSAGNFVWGKTIGGILDEEVNNIFVDSLDNIYIYGKFEDTVDFDPGLGVYELGCSVGTDLFICKLDANGNFVWAKKIGNSNTETFGAMDYDINGNILITGTFDGSVDFDLGPGTSILTGATSAFIGKYDLNADLVWAKNISTALPQTQGYGIEVDSTGGVYIMGDMTSGTLDFDSGIGVSNITYTAASPTFVLKLDQLGNFKWVKSSGGIFPYPGNYTHIDKTGNLFITNSFNGTDNFDPSVAGFSLTSAGSADIVILKYIPYTLKGKIYNDLSFDCIQNVGENGLQGKKAVINPGNILVETDVNGNWYVDYLPIGSYTITLDTSSGWSSNCVITQNFSVANANVLTTAPTFGLFFNSFCPSPEVSVVMPSIKPCFTNQQLFIHACNSITATDLIAGSYVDLELDGLITPSSASMAFTALGNNTFRFNTGNLNPGDCIDITVEADVSCLATVGQTICLKADLKPLDNCSLDNLPTPNGGGVLPCSLPYDNSSIDVNNWCDNDSIYFTLQNIGTGNMICYSPYRIYLDEDLIIQDSFLLNAGEIDTLIFSGDGRTWRLEADQHPLHPGNSHPSTFIESCGIDSNWTPGLVNIFPMNDADGYTDIYCGEVSASFDPNDKTGYPLGITDTHFISSNQKMEYIIQFQNTGNAPATTVVVRDTLENDFEILSVVSGASSHDYTFAIVAPRVLEWTFSNIMLPDSTSDEAGSHGFVSFTVNQNPDLITGTELNNEVGIYFDFNPVVITNTTTHIIRNLNPSASVYIDTSRSICDGSIEIDGFEYHQNGVYYQLQDDSVFVFTLANNSSSTSLLMESNCYDYTLNNQIYSLTGTYYQTLMNSKGCDSLITLNLIITEDSDSIMNIISCDDYVLNSQTYASTGTYSQTLTNVKGCDSLITLNLTIHEDSDSIMNIISCNTYELNSQIYSSSGTFTQNLMNSNGCDSLITLNLTINNIDSSVTQNNFTLTATTSGASYQWLDCNNGFYSILTATNQSFTPVVNGSYAVSVTKNGCTDTSACFTISTIGVSENSFGENIRVYPNPSNGKLFIDLGMKTEKMNVSVKNAIGQIVFSESYQNKNILELNLNVERGIYFVEIMNEDGSRKILKLIID